MRLQDQQSFSDVAKQIQKLPWLVEANIVGGEFNRHDVTEAMTHSSAWATSAAAGWDLSKATLTDVTQVFSRVLEQSTNAMFCAGIIHVNSRACDNCSVNAENCPLMPHPMMKFAIPTDGIRCDAPPPAEDRGTHFAAELAAGG
jgi:hypothetical protein